MHGSIHCVGAWALVSWLRLSVSELVMHCSSAWSWWRTCERFERCWLFRWRFYAPQWSAERGEVWMPRQDFRFTYGLGMLMTVGISP